MKLRAEVTGVRKIGMYLDEEGKVPLMALELVLPLQAILDNDLGPGAWITLELEAVEGPVALEDGPLDQVGLGKGDGY